MRSARSDPPRGGNRRTTKLSGCQSRGRASARLVRSRSSNAALSSAVEDPLPRRCETLQETLRSGLERRALLVDPLLQALERGHDSLFVLLPLLSLHESDEEDREQRERQRAGHEEEPGQLPTQAEVSPKQLCSEDEQQDEGQPADTEADAKQISLKPDAIRVR
jgi:hypothetical protein